MFAPLIIAIAIASDPGARPECLAPELAVPIHVLVGGKPVDVERSGHAAPCFGDIDGNGKPALLVGQYDGGKLRIYRNSGDVRHSKFDSFTWFRAGADIGRVPVG
jgi:hypothetical protein